MNKKQDDTNFEVAFASYNPNTMALIKEFVEAFKSGEALNYISLRMSYDHFEDDWRDWEVIIQRRKGKTVAEVNGELREENIKLKKEIQAYRDLHL